MTEQYFSLKINNDNNNNNNSKSWVADENIKFHSIEVYYAMYHEDQRCNDIIKTLKWDFNILDFHNGKERAIVKVNY